MVMAPPSTALYVKKGGSYRTYQTFLTAQKSSHHIEVKTMKLLLIHADFMEYEAGRKTKGAEERQ